MQNAEGRRGGRRKGHGRELRGGSSWLRRWFPFEQPGPGWVKRFVNAATLLSRARYWWRKEIRWWLALGLVIFSIRSSLADWSDVPTGSMKPTILEGDRVFVNKLAYDLKVPFTTCHIAQWSNPQRGDIVVFFSPRDGHAPSEAGSGFAGRHG